MSSLFAATSDYLYSMDLSGVEAINGILAQRTTVAGSGPGGSVYAVDLGVAMVPEFVAFFGLVGANASFTVYASTGPSLLSFPSTVVASWTVYGSTPNFWLDLRSTPTAARYWIAKFKLSGEVSFGKIVVGAFSSVRAHLWDFSDLGSYPEYAKGSNDYGVFARTKKGFQTRARLATWRLPYTSGGRSILERLSEEMGQQPGPVLFVPDDTLVHASSPISGTDIWFLDWQDDIQVTPVVDNYYEIKVPLVEHSPGVVT